MHLHREAVRRRFFDDPPDTSDARVRGVSPPDVLTLRPAQRLIWRAGVYSPGYWRLHDRADWRGVHPCVQLHAGRCIQRAMEMGVPLYVARSGGVDWHPSDAFDAREGLSFRLLHCRYHGLLEPDEWQFVTDLLAQEALRLVYARCELPYRRGEGPGWCCWHDLDDAPRPSGEVPVRMTPVALGKAFWP